MSTTVSISVFVVSSVVACVAQWYCCKRDDAVREPDPVPLIPPDTHKGGYVRKKAEDVLTKDELRKLTKSMKPHRV